MAGTSISSRMGSKVIGKYGTYFIKKKIGNGGNGVVFVADIIEGSDSLPQKRDYAIKFLDVAPNEEEKLEKRKLRFRLAELFLYMILLYIVKKKQMYYGI